MGWSRVLLRISDLYGICLYIKYTKETEESRVLLSARCCVIKPTNVDP